MQLHLKLYFVFTLYEIHLYIERLGQEERLTPVKHKYNC